MENHAKETILSIVGVAILVIAVVGVSFAFFTYSRTGEKNNVITTGSITFALTPGSQHPNITGKDFFPQENEEAMAADYTDNLTEFNVAGTLPASANAVTYKVYAIPGTEPTAEQATAPEGGWKRFKDSEISLSLSVDNGGSTSSAPTIEDGFETGKAIGTLAADVQDGTNTKGLLLASGTLEAGTTLDATFSLRMWINNTVTISDTNSSYTYRASSTDEGDIPTDKDKESNPDTREVFNEHYYSIKIQVVASDDPSFAA